MDQAFNTMHEGRRGQVLVDVPQDLQANTATTARTGSRLSANPRNGGAFTAIAIRGEAIAQCRFSFFLFLGGGGGGEVLPLLTHNYIYS